MIFDTCFVIDFLYGDKDAIKFLSENILNDLEILSISVFELYQKKKSPKKEFLTSKFLERFNIIDLNMPISIKGGKIFSELKSKGLEIDGEDCLIAACALSKDSPVVTRNVKHFKRIKGLKILKY